MKNINKLFLVLISLNLLASCGGGGGGSSAEGAPTPAPSIPMAYTTVFTSFNNGSPLTGSGNSIQNTINPATNKPIYQLNSINYGNTALSLGNSWSISAFGNGTLLSQNLVLDTNGNIDQVSAGLLTVYAPSNGSILNTYNFDTAVNLNYAVINPSNNTIYGYSSTGAYSCPVNGATGSCMLLASISALPKRLQYVSNNLYASVVQSDGSNLLSIINSNTGVYTQHSLSIPMPFQIDEFAPDPADLNTIYFIGLKASGLYMSIFKCTLNNNICSILYDNVTTTTNAFSRISADVNFLYFMHTQTKFPTISYSIAQVSK